MQPCSSAHQHTLGVAARQPRGGSMLLKRVKVLKRGRATLPACRAAWPPQWCAPPAPPAALAASHRRPPLHGMVF